MIRFAILMTLSMIASQAQAAPGPADDGCAAAFLTEHLGQEDGAAMLKLWDTSSADEPDRTGTLAAASDPKSGQHMRAASRFLALRGQYQVRCPAQDMAFE